MYLKDLKPCAHKLVLTIVDSMIYMIVGPTLEDKLFITTICDLSIANHGDKHAEHIYLFKLSWVRFLNNWQLNPYG